MGPLTTSRDQAATIAAQRALLDPAKSQLAENVQIRACDGRIAAMESGRGGDGLLALPAPVNAHDHGYGIRPLDLGCDDDCLECWIPGLTARPPTDPQLEAEVAFGRMALSGIGSTMHCHNSLLSHKLEEEAAAVCTAATRVGLRVGFSCPVVDDNAWVYGGPEKLRPLLPAETYRKLLAMQPPAVPGRAQVERVAAIARDLESPCFSVQYGPIGPQWCRLETLEAIAAASADEGRRVHMHLLESKRQRDWLDHAHPGGVLRMLDSIGLLSPRLTIAHGVWLNDAECELLAERGVTIAINAASNLRLRSGIAPLARFAKYGVAVAVGTDGMTLNDDQDYLADLRLTRYLNNGTGLVEEVPAGSFLQQALSNGFHTVCGESGYGRLVPDAHADILLLDYATIARNLVDDSATGMVNLLHARMSAAHVRHLFVAGNEIVRDGNLQCFDFPAAEAELIAQAGAGVVKHDATLELIDKQRTAIRRYYTETTGM